MARARSRRRPAGGSRPRSLRWAPGGQPQARRVVHEYLAQQGFSAEQLGRFKSPAGLDIQARRGNEIALSIMAEIVQRRRNSAELAWLPAPPAAQPEPAPLVATDPICGMSVMIAGAKYSYNYQGTTYYFCCPGCKTTFRKAPAQHALARLEQH
jgi:xanthine dehydrogenase accessory factor